MDWLSYCLKLFCNWFMSSLWMQNKEAEKQVKFFQGCVAAAFAERDNSLMEVLVLLS